MAPLESAISHIIDRFYDRILRQWITAQSNAGVLRPDLIREKEIRRQSAGFLDRLRAALAAGAGESLEDDRWTAVREMLEEVTAYRVQHGFMPTEMATFILSLKQPVFDCLREAFEDDPRRITEEAWYTSVLLDKLGLYTSEIYLRGREEIIQRQQHEMLELSSPVVKLWDRIVALPLIGTLDSARAQIVMENLLEAVVKTRAEIVIIDITGVPTVDTLVAQHLMKTAAAAKLMGAQCIISGIRPQIAQTIVHLGVEMPQVVTKANLESAFTDALRRTGIVLQRA